MKITLVLAQVTVSLLVLLFVGAGWGWPLTWLATACVVCMLALPFVALLDVMGLFRAIFR